MEFDEKYDACCASQDGNPEDCLYPADVDGVEKWLSLKFYSPKKFTHATCSSNPTEKPDITSGSSSGSSSNSNECDCSGRRPGTPSSRPIPEHKRIRYFKMVGTNPQIIDKSDNKPRRKLPQGPHGPNGPGGIAYCTCP